MTPTFPRSFWVDTDGELFENLASFAQQDHPAFELVLGCEDLSDPALAVARRVAREFPSVPITLVAGGRSMGLNPKVNNSPAWPPLRGTSTMWSRTRTSAWRPATSGHSRPR